MDAQRGVFSHVSGSFTQNSISNIREYNEKTGGWTSKPENINGNWNVFGMFGMNTALKANPKFTFDSKEYYVFLLMSSKDVTKIMKKIEKIRLKV